MGIFNLFKKNKTEQEVVDTGVCPNCWGRQEYEGHVIEVARDRQIDINNHDSTATQAFVQDFVTQHISGIRLQNEGAKTVCARCKAEY